MRRRLPKDPMKPVAWGPLSTFPLAAMPRDCSWCGRPFQKLNGGHVICMNCDHPLGKSDEPDPEAES